MGHPFSDAMQRRWGKRFRQGHGRSTGSAPVLERLEPRLLMSGSLLGLDHDHHDDHDHDHDHDDDHLIHAFPLPDPALVVEGVNSDGASAGSSSSGPLAGVPLGETFNLHSNPGAEHTIFLDFDGHTTSDTIWNSFHNGGADIITPAYDFDGDTGFFSDSELQRIQNIWQRVAEDFLPFDVNVTTEDPGEAALSKSGSSDTQWGGRVVIGGGSHDWYGAGAGGVAYLGSFNFNNDTPSYVFENQLGNGNEKYVAEAITHEAGHMLHLRHDGTSSTGYYSGHGSGETGWASIMGVGYYENLTQWSKGEYADANNSEDDLAVITSRNGFGYRADDHAGTTAQATTLDVTAGAASATGIIERNTDFDLFAFETSNGEVSFDINPAVRGPNLDVMVELLDTSGAVIASANPTNLLSASIGATLSAGSYFLRVSGAGQGDPLGSGYSDYGSLGAYSISGSVAEPPRTVSVNDVVVSEADGLATFTVTLSEARNEATTVDITTFDDDAVAGSDYVATATTLTIPAGETTQTFTVAIDDDDVHEQTEAFGVMLSNVSGGVTIDDGVGEAVITDNDLAPDPILVNVSGSWSAERNLEADGPQYSWLQFDVTLSESSDSPVTVHFATADGTAAAGLDYVAVTDTLVIPAGQTAGTIRIDVLGDTVVELEETVTLNLTHAEGAQIADGVATGMILDNDSHHPGPMGMGTEVAKMIATLDESAPEAAPVTPQYSTSPISLLRNASTPPVTNLLEHTTPDHLDLDADDQTDEVDLSLRGLIDLLAAARV